MSPQVREGRAWTQHMRRHHGQHGRPHPGQRQAGEREWGLELRGPVGKPHLLLWITTWP